MSNQLILYCRSSKAIPPQEIATFVEDGAFFDHRPSFQPPPDSADAARPDWGFMEIIHDPKRRPVQIEQILGEDEIGEVVDNAVERLGHAGHAASHPALVAHLRASRKVFVIEVSAELPEEAWEMLDTLEAYLCRELDGIVMAHEGIYDADLQLIVPLA
jgi:hypothetical protein